MISPALFRELVPDAPPFRRTEGDPPATRALKKRALSESPRPGTTMKLDTPRLVSTFRGSIDKLLFAFPNWATTAPELVAGYRSLIEALRPGTGFVVVHQEAGKRPIQSWFEAAGHDLANVEFVEMPGFVSFTDWAEDAFVSVIDSDSGTHYLVEPWEFHRGGDALIADAVQGSTDSRATQTPLIFQGGNCLITDSAWLIGKDYYVDTLNLLQGDRTPLSIPAQEETDAFVRRLFSEYLDTTREMIVVGTDDPVELDDFVGVAEGDEFYLDMPARGAGTYQPIFHIDMFLTPLPPSPNGPPRFLVGNPAMADMMLGTVSPYALPEIYQRIGQDLLRAGFEVFAIPLAHLAKAGRILPLAELDGRAREQSDQALTKAVDQLKAAGATDATPVTMRTWHHVTWNNCLVECSARLGDHVYMPTFGHGPNAALSKLDDYVADVWTKLGFQVHALGDFNPFAERMGVVHCIKKYMKRGD